MARFVLVHGAWHGSWCWERLVPALEKAGHTAVVVDLPSAGKAGDLAADAAVVRAAIEQGNEPTVVVGHSYGGVVITEAAAGCAQAQHLVFLCAFMLPAGQSLLGFFGGPAPWVHVDEAAGHSLAMSPKPIFYNGVDDDAAETCANRLCGQSLSSFVQPLTETAWQTIPSTYIACTQDQAIPFGLQQKMAENAKNLRVMESGHSPFLSHVDELVRILEDIAKG